MDQISNSSEPTIYRHEHLRYSLEYLGEGFLSLLRLFPFSLIEGTAEYYFGNKDIETLRTLPQTISEKITKNKNYTKKIFSLLQKNLIVSLSPSRKAQEIHKEEIAELLFKRKEQKTLEIQNNTLFSKTLEIQNNTLFSKTKITIHKTWQTIINITKAVVDTIFHTLYLFYSSLIYIPLRQITKSLKERKLSHIKELPNKLHKNFSYNISWILSNPQLIFAYLISPLSPFRSSRIITSAKQSMQDL
ncbi:MAG TPA: hypothetical protein P5048_00335 [Chlamydiales bacterium]|nr:hypothetical protein [Chlamydiales bacterium]